jgi:hypothetical protein
LRAAGQTLSAARMMEAIRAASEPRPDARGDPRDPRRGLRVAR